MGPPDHCCGGLDVAAANNARRCLRQPPGPRPGLKHSQPISLGVRRGKPLQRPRQGLAPSPAPPPAFLRLLRFPPLPQRRTRGHRRPPSIVLLAKKDWRGITGLVFGSTEAPFQAVQDGGQSSNSPPFALLIDPDSSVPRGKRDTCSLTLVTGLRLLSATVMALFSSSQSSSSPFCASSHRGSAWRRRRNRARFAGERRKTKSGTSPGEFILGSNPSLPCFWGSIG